MGLDVRERLRRLLRQKLQRAVGEPQAVFSHHLQRLCAGRRIGIGRAGGDHIQRIAQNVGQHDGKDLRGQAALGEPAALDRGEALAQRVHLHDVRAAGEQLLRDVRHLLRGDQRTFKQSRAAAREQEQHGIPLAQPADELQRAARGAVGILIRHGVARLEQLQRTDGTLDMVVFCDDCAAGDRRAQHVIGGLGHLPGGLAGGDQDEPALRLLKLLQRAAHGGIRQRVGQRTNGRVALRLADGVDKRLRLPRPVDDRARGQLAELVEILRPLVQRVQRFKRHALARQPFGHAMPARAQQQPVRAFQRVVHAQGEHLAAVRPERRYGYDMLFAVHYSLSALFSTLSMMKRGRCLVSL